MIPKPDTIEAGDILLIHDSGFSPVSWAIREITNSYWNHCALIKDKDFLIEAIGSGVVVSRLTKYEKKRFHYKISRLRIGAFANLAEYNRGIYTAITNAERRIGNKYDWWGVIGLGILYLFKAGVRKLRKNALQHRNDFFCSELLAACFAGISSTYPTHNLFAGEKNKDISTTTPRDISKSKATFFIDGEDKH